MDDLFYVVDIRVLCRLGADFIEVLPVFDCVERDVDPLFEVLFLVPKNPTEILELRMSEYVLRLYCVSYAKEPSTSGIAQGGKHRLVLKR